MDRAAERMRRIINKLIEWDWRFTWHVRLHRAASQPPPPTSYRGYFPEDYYGSEEVD